MNKKNINLIYFKDNSKNGNFGDELSKFIKSIVYTRCGIVL